MHDADHTTHAPERAVDVGDRFAAVLMGTAVGDALGLPMEGMRTDVIARRFPRLDRYFLFGRVGFVSDDTEQSALVAQSLARHPRSVERFVASFRRSLLGWFLRLPWGIGLGTLRACTRVALGLRRTGVSSAGNGAAMRAAIVGAFFFDAPKARREWGGALAKVTHTDERAVEGARFVAELAALSMMHGCSKTPLELVDESTLVVERDDLRSVIERARRLAEGDSPTEAVARELGNSGFIVHTIGITTFCFLRYGHDWTLATAEAIRAGGDTDSHAAIVGAWMGARHGLGALPPGLVGGLHDGPFGPTHLRALASDLERAKTGEHATAATYSWAAALFRNLALYPVVLWHAFKVVLLR